MHMSKMAFACIWKLQQVRQLQYKVLHLSSQRHAEELNRKRCKFELALASDLRQISDRQSDNLHT